MSERWKYQIKSGALGGFYFAVCLSLVDLKDMSFEEAFLSKRFVFRLCFFLLSGIFVLGYFNWRQKRRSQEAKRKE